MENSLFFIVYLILPKAYLANSSFTNVKTLESLINGLQRKRLASLQPQSIICVLIYVWEERGLEFYNWNYLFQ